MAAASQTDIINSALIRLGVEQITSVTDQSKRARVMQSLYDICRRRVLEDHPWNFAIKRVTLAKTTDMPNWGYQFSYKLPADFLRMVEERSDRGLMSNYYFPTTGSEPIYQIEGDIVVTNKEEMKVLYVFDLVDTSKFSASFVKAFYLDLATEASYSLIQNIQITSDIRGEREKVLADARSIGSGQDHSDDNVDPNDFVAIRAGR